MADREQQHIIRSIIRIGKKRGMPRQAILSALETGSVESHFRNLPGGDRDSQGWRQERAQFYKNPRNLHASINRYYDEWQQDARGKPFDQQAQAVQQSGFPGRYAQKERLAKRLLNRYGSDTPAGANSRSVTRTQRIPGVDNSSLRQQLKLSYLENRNDPNALLDLAYGLQGAEDIPGSVRTTTRTVQGGSRVAGNGDPIMGMLRKAVKWDRAKVPYLWGGGHGSIAKPGQPVDCSGYVSAILGLKTPLVSGQLAQWGKPGKGRNVTVWANEGHVLISIRDPRTKKARWFGTSRSNPGGGAGEISPPDASYLSRFTARHPG